MKLGEIMSLLTSAEAATRLQPRIRSQEPMGFSIDSRTIKPGELFFAVRGEIHDGHNFVKQALDRGALAAVVEWGYRAENIDESSLIRTSDTLRSLQSLASTVLRTWQGFEIAITGSSGKTTTKEITAAVLSRTARVIKSSGNLNNAYGVPLSVLKMESDGAHASDFDFGVFEMGMNHAGEISELTRIAPPDLGVVTNVAAVHLEFFESVDEIAEAKAEMVSGIKPGGAAVLNADDDRVARMRSRRRDVEFRTFGIERNADVMAREIKADGLRGSSFILATPHGEVAAKLPLTGRHNLLNALAAAAIGDFYGVPVSEIASALATCTPPKMRGQLVKLANDITVINDSYNSNPNALDEMIATLRSTECKRRIVVAGEMLELGASGPELHRASGRRISSADIGLLIGVRGMANEIVKGAREAGFTADNAVFCETVEDAAELLLGRLDAGDCVLVKGSRGVRMEIVVERLRKQLGEAPE
ncbi:MAG: UDP-N-acetylmuramoyl-tripeptide--D-alanyl-D-alanine ligase [Blastocatellia bacterium AA13]|nr:MAG: UDP-N-acetylmuramoyl-tripeptide--D-alanyl-D-alanine ligase [Blastocatellia bacterium AA13]